MISKKKLGDEIRQVRKGLSWTQQELAEKTDVTVNYISLLENGHRGIGIDKLDRFAEVFGIPSSFLVMLSEESKKPDAFLVLIQETIREAIPLLAE
ncbi:MAG: helix-turn-helix transcriptional regulator [Phycisphaerales bacterium]|jgi:transcriptional regulator with XRE-family HTH domain|nr:helix-turn-helix transcriptional regulator [Phycisphaerales bacterium]